MAAQPVENRVDQDIPDPTQALEPETAAAPPVENRVDQDGGSEAPSPAPEPVPAKAMQAKPTRERKAPPKPQADKPRPFDPRTMIVPDALNGAAWSEWIDYRAQFRNKQGKLVPLTELAAQKTIKLLTQYPPEVQQEMVDASIRNGWQGLFKPSNTQGTRGNRRGWTQEQEAAHDQAVRKGAAVIAYNWWQGGMKPPLKRTYA